MARRHEDWNVGLAEDLRDREFAREFLLGAIDEGVPLQVALAKVIRAMGVKEFVAKVGMASSNLVRTLNPQPQSYSGHSESAAEAVSTQAKPRAHPGSTKAARRRLIQGAPHAARR
jgi:DNA-binding phage protein